MKLLSRTLLLFFVLYWPQLQAQPVEIDKIIAIIEDDVVTQNELVEEVTSIRNELAGKGRQLPPSASLNKQVLELMITKSILFQEAKKRGITITDTKLNDTMQNLAKRNKLTLAQFRQALIGNGIDYVDFRDEIRQELLITSIKNSYARQNVEITEQEVDDFIRLSGDNNASESRLSHILVALPDGASSDQVTQAKNKVMSLIKELDQGANFAQLASEFSDGNNALRGGDLGWRKPAEIPSLFSDVVTQLSRGQHSQPIRSASGYHIVQLADTRSSEQVLAEETRARHILIKPDEITSEQQARQKLEAIRQQILNGEDFADLAKQHSNDPGSKGLGGDLGWFGKGTMVPEFQSVIESSAIGDTSDIFKSPFGWHILQVLERRMVDETEDVKRKKIKSQLQNQKRIEVLEIWQRRLRDQAFVKIIDR